MDVSLLTFYWIKRKVSSNLLCSKSSNSTNRTHVIYVISLTSRKLVIFDAFQSLVRLTYFSMSTSSSTPSWINFLSKICFLEFLSGIGISIFINRSEIIKIKKAYGQLQRKNLQNFTPNYPIPYGNDPRIWAIYGGSTLVIQLTMTHEWTKIRVKHFHMICVPTWFVFPGLLARNGQ